MPNDKKNNIQDDDQINMVDTDLEETEETDREDAIEELSDDVKEALGLEEEDTLKTTTKVVNVTPDDLDYIPEDIKDTLNEIDNLM